MLFVYKILSLYWNSCETQINEEQSITFCISNCCISFVPFKLWVFRINPLVWSFTIVPSQDIQCQSRIQHGTLKTVFCGILAQFSFSIIRKTVQKDFGFKKATTKKYPKNKKCNFLSWKLPDLKRLKVLYKRWAKIFVKTRSESKDGKKCGLREVPQDKTQCDQG